MEHGVEIMRNRKTKILYIVSTLQSTGPTNQLFGIISNIDLTKFKIYLLTLSPEPDMSRKELFSSLPINILSLNMNRVNFEISGKRKLRKILNEIKPDIIHSCGIRADKSLAGLNIKCKWCNTIRNNVYMDYTSEYGKFIGKIMAAVHIDAIKKVDYPICCSETLKRFYEDLLSRRFYVVQNGVDCRKFNIAECDEKRKIRDKYKIDHNRNVIIFVGELNIRKDPLTIIKVFKMKEIKEKCILYVLGDGELLEKCRSEASDNVIFLGKVKNVSEYMKLADGFISASKAEGLPNSVLEAGACGIPMLLSDIAEHKEIFGEEFSGIKYFSVNDEEDLFMKMKHWIMDLNNVDKDAIGEHILRNFNSKSMSRKYQLFYKSILDR